MFPTKSDIYYHKIKIIISNDIYIGDKDISQKLKKLYDIDISSVHVAQIRKKYLIPSKSKRVKEQSLDMFLNYASKPLPLNSSNIYTVPQMSGVYILLQYIPYTYQYDQSMIIYIGMSGNLNQRLKAYNHKSSHTLPMQKILNTQSLQFSYIKAEYYEQLETMLLDLFTKEYGELPLLNFYYS